MPFEPIPGTCETCALLAFDADGHERTDDPHGDGGLLSRAILRRAAQHPPSHVFLFSHGWQGDVVEARLQYGRWIAALLAVPYRPAAMRAFVPLWIGLHWPSLPFGDEELGGADFAIGDGALSPADLVAVYAERLGLGDAGVPLLRTIVERHFRDAAATTLPADARRAYTDLAALAGYASTGPGGAPDAEGAPFDADAAFDRGTAVGSADFGGLGGLLGGLLGPLRQLSYWQMKRRARIIGEGGMHRFVADLMRAVPGARVHLMGHSFGTIVVASLIGGPGATQALPRPVDSVALLQGAVSLWAFGEEVHGRPVPGYFNPWVRRGAVRGPVIVSRSIHDRAVGVLYPWASALSLSDGSFAVDGDDLPFYGAIGRFGVHGLPGVVTRDMLPCEGDYRFEPGRVYNLEASRFIARGGGVTGAHSDIEGPEVAHAIWQAALV